MFISPIGNTHDRAVLADSDATVDEIVVARLTHQEKKSSKCFNHAFLAEVDRESKLSVKRAFDTVDVNSEDIFKYPMLVMSGEKAFTLTEEEKANLKKYLTRGGFLLASADCADEKWNESFQAIIQEILPDQTFAPLSLEHSVFDSLFEVERIITVKPAENPLWGLSINGRLTILYSPIGLNDSEGLGAECCCCGANEIRNARQINANALVYAATH